jgi:hypothetical protein
MPSLSPVLLFTYNRFSETERTIRALRANYLASESDLIVYSDGSRSHRDDELVHAVRRLIRKIDGFKSVSIVEARENKGLARSIIDGVSSTLRKYDRVIVLEDDLVTSPNFLDYMNHALRFYSCHGKVLSVAGFTFDLPGLKDNPLDAYFGYRASSWGWGTWRDRWEPVDWDVSDFGDFARKPYQWIRFARGGIDMPRMLFDQVAGRIDSWAIRWCYHQWKHNLLTVFPTCSKVQSIGFGENATHTKGARRFDTTLDQGELTSFRFDPRPAVDQRLAKEFRERFSISTRLRDKVALLRDEVQFE